jgi:invasion protein IalB
MCCIVSRVFSIIVVAGLFATPAASEEVNRPGLIYSPWSKMCIEGICFVGMDVRSECGLVVGAVLIEKNGETKKTLRVTLPARVNSERGVRIVVDQGQPITRPYDACVPNGCMADHEGGAELVEQLKQGQILFLEGVDAANSPINLSVPLLDFAKAYDGPRHEPVFQEALVLSQRDFEQQKRAEEARKMRCDSATPIR